MFPQWSGQVRGLVLGLTLVVGACRTGAPVTLPGAAGLSVPRGLVGAVETAWPGAELGVSTSAVCPGTSGAPTAGIAGDFNGDNMADLAFWIARDGRPHLVVGLARLEGEYDVVDAGVPLEGPVGQLELGRRGATYRGAGGVDEFFGMDTLIRRGCDGARTVLTWTGTGFRAQAIDGK